MKFNPSIFYLGAHSSYPNFAKLIGNNVEGILGMSILSKKNPNAKKFFEDFIGKQGKEADTFFAVSTFASHKKKLSRAFFTLLAQNAFYPS